MNEFENNEIEATELDRFDDDGIFISQKKRRRSKQRSGLIDRGTRSSGGATSNNNRYSILSGGHDDNSSINSSSYMGSNISSDKNYVESSSQTGLNVVSKKKKKKKKKPNTGTGQMSKGVDDPGEIMVNLNDKKTNDQSPRSLEGCNEPINNSWKKASSPTTSLSANPKRVFCRAGWKVERKCLIIILAILTAFLLAKYLSH